ncbi:MBL fold metallo-hydrolase [Nonomuraea insulae]|uniref:Rhodanese-like domain-containing protein n=1 Tax=Nonomuraea insulae TaxID=1616787 RepID=A0ABW1D9U0_9ACTN
MRTEILDTPELGDRSYLIHNGDAAIVVDPQRDVERLLAIADGLGVGIDLVLETHIHNDYVSGGRLLATTTGARYAVNAEDPVGFPRLGIGDGDRLTAGSLSVQVLATPGHTHTHLSYVVADLADSGPPAVFTGGSLLYGGVGRTDLAGPRDTEELTRAQFRSAHRLARILPPATALYPTHGFGSFCSAGAATEGHGDGHTSTIGGEVARNDALTASDEETFVRALLARLTAYPGYYAHMASLNHAGAGPIDLTGPEPVDPAELGARIAAGEWVIDLRERIAYAADHVMGTVNVGLDTRFATYVGWLVPWGRPLTLIGARAGDIRRAQRQLGLIGIARPSGAAAGDLATIAGPLDRGGYERVTFAGVPEPSASDVLLDVRRDDEWAAGHVDGAVHTPLAELTDRLPQIPPGRVWVHCAGGYRASSAASLLHGAGRDVVLVDDDFANATCTGLAIVGADHPL